MSQVYHPTIQEISCYYSNLHSIFKFQGVAQFSIKKDWRLKPRPKMRENQNMSEIRASLNAATEKEKIKIKNVWLRAFLRLLKSPAATFGPTVPWKEERGP